MELTFVTDLGQSFVIEIDPNMELESVMALLEAEVRILDAFLIVVRLLTAHRSATACVFRSYSQASLSMSKAYPSRVATSATLTPLWRASAWGATLCFFSEEKSASQEGASYNMTLPYEHLFIVYPARRTAEQDAEMMRLQILGDPNLMAQLRAVRLTPFKWPTCTDIETGRPCSRGSRAVRFRSLY